MWCCPPRRMVTLASGLQLNLGLGLVLLGVGGLSRPPTAVLWPTLAVIVCGLLSIALSYSMLVAFKRPRTLLVVGYTGWFFTLLFAALATQFLVHVHEIRPSAQAVCETFRGASCADATLNGVDAYYTRCALASRCALGMSMIMLSWGVVQQWRYDVHVVSACSTRLLGGLLALLTIAGGAATTGVAGLMAPDKTAVATWHPAVAASVIGVGGLGIVSALVGTLTCRRTARQPLVIDSPTGGLFLLRQTACCHNTGVPRMLAVAWVCLGTVLLPWSLPDEARSNFDQRWAAYSSAWPEVTARYCTEAVGLVVSEYSESSGLVDGLYDHECALAGFREAQSLYSLAASAIAVAFFVQLFIVWMLRRAMSVDSFTINTYGTGIDVPVMHDVPTSKFFPTRRLTQSALGYSSDHPHLDQGEV